MDEANALAKACVDSVRSGGTIIPRIVPLDEDELIVESLYEATDRFDIIVENMINSDEIVNRKKVTK